MAVFRNFCQFSNTIKSVQGLKGLFLHRNGPQNPAQSTFIIKRDCSTKKKKGLMEFFDDEKNWGTNEVKTGRSWKKEEMRIKSNSDLHKLWYVLLKERNMLLTMEEECKEQVRLFPNPERRDKVEESMENLEEVVRERNRAYHELETGLSGERKNEEIMGPFGFPVPHTQEEHLIPKHLNKEWQKEHEHNINNKDVKEFLAKRRERQHLELRKKKNRDLNHVIGLLKRFPDMDMEALKQEYPDVDIERAKNSRKCRGHFVPK